MSKSFENAQNSANSGKNDQKDLSSSNGQTSPGAFGAQTVSNEIARNENRAESLIDQPGNQREVEQLRVSPTSHTQIDISDRQQFQVTENPNLPPTNPMPAVDARSLSPLYDDSTGQSVLRTPQPQRYRFLNSPPNFQVFAPSMFKDPANGQEEDSLNEVAVYEDGGFVEDVENGTEDGYEEEKDDEMMDVEESAENQQISEVTKGPIDSNQPESTISSSMAEMLEILEISSDEGGPHSYINRPSQPPPKFRISQTPQGMVPIGELSETSTNSSHEMLAETSDRREVLHETEDSGIPQTSRAQIDISDSDRQESQNNEHSNIAPTNPMPAIDARSLSPLYDDSTNQSVLRTPQPQRYRFMHSPPKFQVFAPSMFIDPSTEQQEDSAGEDMEKAEEMTGNEAEYEEEGEQMMDVEERAENQETPEGRSNDSNQPESSMSLSMVEMVQILNISSDEGGPHSYLNRPSQTPPKNRISHAPHGLLPIVEVSATSSSSTTQPVESISATDNDNDGYDESDRSDNPHRARLPHDRYRYSSPNDYELEPNDDQHRARLPHDGFRSLSPVESGEEWLARRRALRRRINDPVVPVAPVRIPRQTDRHFSDSDSDMGPIDVVRGPGIVIRSKKSSTEVMLTDHLYDADQKMDFLDDELLVRTEGRVPNKRISIATDNSVDLIINGVPLATMEARIRARIADEMKESQKMFQGILVPREIYGELCRKWRTRQSPPHSQRAPQKRSAATSPAPPAKRSKTTSATDLALPAPPISAPPTPQPIVPQVLAAVVAIPAPQTPPPITPQVHAAPTPPTVASVPPKKRGRPPKSAVKTPAKPAAKKVHGMKLRSDSAKAGLSPMKFKKLDKSIVSIRDVRLVLDNITAAFNSMDFGGSKSSLTKRLQQLREMSTEYLRNPSTRKFTQLASKCSTLEASVELHAR